MKNKVDEGVWDSDIHIRTRIAFDQRGCSCYLHDICLDGDYNEGYTNEELKELRACIDKALAFAEQKGGDK